MIHVICENKSQKEMAMVLLLELVEASFEKTKYEIYENPFSLFEFMGESVFIFIN